MLLATDGSDGALEAARWVAELAARAPGLRIKLLYVFPQRDPTLATVPGAHGLLPDEPDEEMARRAAQLPLAKTRRVLARVPAHVVSAIRIGSPAQEIVLAAEADDVDAIVVGKHTQTGLAQLLSANISERVLRLSHRPVVVVPTRTAD